MTREQESKQGLHLKEESYSSQLDKLIEGDAIWLNINTAPTDKRILIKDKYDEVHCATWVKDITNDDIAWCIAAIDNDEGTLDRVVIRDAVAWMPLNTPALLCAEIKKLREANEVMCDYLQYIIAECNYNPQNPRIVCAQDIYHLATKALAKVQEILNREETK